MAKRETKSEASFARAKRRWFVGFTVTFPFLLLLFFELILRAVNYGPNLSLFITQIIGGKKYYLMNPEVKGRYFSKVEFSPNTSPDYFTVPKHPGTFRIFCLGGSTTVGFPYGYVGSFPTLLRDRLKRVFPEKSIEVINLGMTATNSYTDVDIARELVSYEPNLICLYSGHNEFYGAMGIASRESIARSHWITKQTLRLVHLRTFLLARDIYRLFSHFFAASEGTGASGTMMERLARGQYVRLGSETYKEALQSFEDNLEELKAICREQDIPLFVGSQVSNLKDQPPFVSEDSPGWSQKEKLSFNVAFNRGVAHQLDGHPDSALVDFKEALSYDSLRADVQFRIATCLDSLSHFSDALYYYTAARDDDMLRFRASTDFNKALLRLNDDAHVFSVDIDRAFRAHSRDSLIGYNLILEHLHPNEEGNFLIAREFASAMINHHVFGPSISPGKQDSLDDAFLWDHRETTALDSMCAFRRVRILTSGWPFQANERKAISVVKPSPLDTIAEEMVNGDLTWEEGHFVAAQFYERYHDLGNAEEEYTSLLGQIPLNVSTYSRLAKLYMQEGRNAEAKGILLRSASIEYTLFTAKTLGVLTPDPKEAIPFFEKALSLSRDKNDKTESAFLLADACFRAGKLPQSRQYLQRLLSEAPEYSPAIRLLQQIDSVNR